MIIFTAVAMLENKQMKIDVTFLCPSPNTCTWNPNNFSCTSGSKSQALLFCCHAKLRLPRISPHHSRPVPSLLASLSLIHCSIFCSNSILFKPICYLSSLFPQPWWMRCLFCQWCFLFFFFTSPLQLMRFTAMKRRPSACKHFNGNSKVANQVASPGNQVSLGKEKK